MGEATIGESISAYDEIIPTREFPQHYSQHALTPTPSSQVLQRASGILTNGNIQFDKSKPKTWKADQVRVLLTDDDLGFGFDEEDISNLKLKGFELENVVDALISFNGDKEVKISQACTT